MENTTLILTNTEYNLSKQLDKELEFLWYVDGYVKDAESDGNKQAAEAFKKIKDDEIAHAKILRELLSKSLKT
jgi:rubrerythrin